MKTSSKENMVHTFNLRQNSSSLSYSDYKKLYLKCIGSKYGRVFENIIKSIYTKILSEGDICVDGGAHKGLHTFPLSKLVGSQGKVYAFEALPHLAQSLETKIADQRTSNITVIPKALTNQESNLTFNFLKDCPGKSGIKQRSYNGDVKPAFEQITVESILIDRVLENEKSWRFCKLDLEGGEFHCLQGALRSIKKFSPFIIFENGRQRAANIYGYTCEDWFSFFKEIDYKIFDLFGREFKRKHWKSQFIPFYFIAVKSQSMDEEFVINYLPSILQTFLVDNDIENSDTVVIDSDTNGFFLKVENQSAIYLKDKEGNMSPERFPWVNFMGVKRFCDTYEILLRFNNGKLSEWIVDGSGFKLAYHSLDEENLVEIASYFKIDEKCLITT